jgi:hypothetical protein
MGSPATTTPALWLPFRVVTASVQPDWVSTLAGRIGFTGPGFDHWLFYAKGGAPRTKKELKPTWQPPMKALRVLEPKLRPVSASVMLKDLKHKSKTAGGDHYRAQGPSGAEKASDNRQRDCSENPDLFRKQPPRDDLPVSFEGQFTHRLRRDGGCLENTGQTTSWWRAHALDISQRSRRSSTQGCRPSQQPMERILAQNRLVRRDDRGRLCRLIIV